MDLKQLGKRLQELRIKKFGTNSADFQAASGLSRGTVYDIEKGLKVHGPGINTLERWIQTCGSSLREFFGTPTQDDFQVGFNYDPAHDEFYQNLEEVLSGPDIEVRSSICVMLDLANRRPPRAYRQSRHVKKESGATGSSSEAITRQPKLRATGRKVRQEKNKTGKAPRPA